MIHHSERYNLQLPCWRLYETRQPPTSLCTASNSLMVAIVIMVATVMLVMVVKVNMVVMVVMVVRRGQNCHSNLRYRCNFSAFLVSDWKDFLIIWEEKEKVVCCSIISKGKTRAPAVVTGILWHKTKWIQDILTNIEFYLITCYN